MRTLVSALILVIALIMTVAYQLAFHPGTGVPTRVPLENVPWGIAGDDWVESRLPLQADVVRKSGVTEYLNCVFASGDGVVGFYVGYYDGSRIESIHQPEICFPGSGWVGTERQVETLALDGVGDVPFNVILFEKLPEKKLTAYTFYYRGRFEPDQRAVELGRAFDDRNFAIITISASVTDAREEAHEVLEEFLRRLLPKVLDHLPDGEAPAKPGEGDRRRRLVGMSTR